MKHHNVVGIPTSIRILKFLITESGVYNPMYRRSYQTEMDAGTLGAIQEKVATSSKITPQMLGGMAGRFIMPSAAPEQMSVNGHNVARQIMIPGGWDDRRLRFQMVVETTFSPGGTITEHIQGWTDRLGVSHTGNVEPQMEFFINSILKVRKQIDNTPFGAINRFNVVDATHVLVDNNNTQIYNPDMAERLRPEDVFSALLRETYNNVGSFRDVRTAHTATPVLANRKDGIPTNYLSDLMFGYQSAVIDPTDSTGESSEHYNKAKGIIAAPSIQMDAFISAISNLRRQPAANSFTFADLVRLDPNVAQVTKYSRAGIPQISTQASMVADSQKWDTVSLSTQAAVLLANAVPALLMELGFTGINFSSTNRNLSTFVTPGGYITTMIGEYLSFSNIDMTNHLNTFKHRLEHEIIPGLTMYNQLEYMLEMHVDLLGDTRIKIAIAGEDPATYFQPSFADALAVPTLTNDVNRVHDIVDDIGLFLNAVIPTDSGNGGNNGGFGNGGSNILL